MHHYIAKIQHKPAFTRLALDATFFLVIFFCCFEHAFRKRVEHAVTRAVADHEIIGKGSYIFNVKKQDVFALMVLQGVDDFMSKV